MSPTKLSFKERAQDLYVNNQILYSTHDIINKVAAGTAVEILDRDGYNVTQEFLMNAAFKTPEVAWDYLYNNLTEDNLTDIIEVGGAISAIERKMRGLDE